MDTKHTPGPWAATHNSWDVSSVYASSGPVAECHIDSEVDEATQDQWELIKEANARLIAAAPELLEALQAAVECGLVPVSSVKDGGATRHVRQVQVADQIRAAISKAIGA